MVRENEHQFGGKMATLCRNCAVAAEAAALSFASAAVSIVITRDEHHCRCTLALQSIYSGDTINWNRTLNYADKQQWKNTRDK